jgi:hypothetical protein
MKRQKARKRRLDTHLDKQRLAEANTWEPEFQNAFYGLFEPAASRVQEILDKRVTSDVLRNPRGRP